MERKPKSYQKRNRDSEREGVQKRKELDEDMEAAAAREHHGKGKQVLMDLDIGEVLS